MVSINLKKSVVSLLLILSLLLSVLSLAGCDSLFPSGNNGGTNGTLPESKDGHIDENDDGVCDDCSCSVIVLFDFYSINDLHGKITDSTTQAGIEELTTYLKQKREANPNTIFLSSGDMWQGSSESNLTGGKIITDWMNELDFVSMTLGNHEYDWGEEFIEANAELAEFPLLAINVYDKDTNKRADYCDASVMVEVDGIKIGIIGAIGDCYSSIASDKRDGVYFKVGTQLTELVKAESKSLRERGADVIIYSLHDGYGKSVSGSNGVLTGSMSDSYYDMELSRGGYVDIVFEGHSHQSYALKDTAGVYHIQGGGDNSGICHAKLEINFARNEAQTLSASSLSDGSYKHYAEDELIDKLLEKYKNELALANKVLGTNSHKRYSNELKQKVAELYCELGLKTWGSEYDIVLGGGYLNTRSPYNLDAGEVRYSDLQSLLPFDNAIVLCSIKGSDLKRRFTETDNDTYYVSYSEYGASIRYNIDPNATYYIITDSYCSTYAANRLTEIARYDDSTFARDLLAKYIEDGGYS